MRQSDRLRLARKLKRDEFYTSYSDIEKELRYYEKHLRGKVVYCNTDDPKFSNFWKYFKDNFERFGLKKLVSMYYKDKGNSEVTMFDGTKKTVAKLKSNGDFRSPECIEILKESDIVITNPPFSMFVEYMNFLFKYKKDFLVIGNMNSIANKDIFPYIQSGFLSLGYNGNVPMTFELGKNYDMIGGAFVGNDGKRYCKLGMCSWYTNLNISKKREFLNLTKKYIPDDFQTYVNCIYSDVINVNKVSDIPKDYFGIMGVPVSFINKFCFEQFEIIGLDKDCKINMSKLDIPKDRFTNNGYRFFVVDKEKSKGEKEYYKGCYIRILIRRK